MFYHRERTTDLWSFLYGFIIVVCASDHSTLLTASAGCEVLILVVGFFVANLAMPYI